MKDKNVGVSKLDPAVREVITKYEAARDAKETLGLTSDWRKYEDYCRNKQNEAVEEDDPGSVTNVIFPIIASQVADLVDEPMQITATGEEPSDQVFATDVEHILDWILFQNRMFVKLDRHEWRRLKLGCAGFKMFYDPVTSRIIFDPFSPVNFFPDPQVKEPWQLQQADFIAHANMQSILYLKRVHGSVAYPVKPQRSQDNLNIFEGETNEETRAETSNKARVIELWTVGANNKLRRRLVGNETMIYDSKHDLRSSSTFYDHGKYPFCFSQCYPLEGRLWGMGDAELLLPTQDLINDFDDQIRRNARLMGNIQVVVGLASGINIKKWTGKAGLKLPARDHTAWQTVQPPSIPDYIISRRIQGLNEAEIISGRPDVVEGRRSGVRAASAIMALQEAGSRRGRHKKMMLQETLTDGLYFCVDYLKQFYTEEQAFRILGKNMDDPTAPPNYLWFKGSKLKEIPRLVPDGLDGMLKPLLDKQSKPVTKDAKFDLRLSIGAGLPHNRTFLYNALMDMVKEGIMTREEARFFLKDSLDWPVANPSQPEGDNFGAGLITPGGRSMGPGQMPGGQPVDMNTGALMNVIQSLLQSQGGAVY